MNITKAPDPDHVDHASKIAYRVEDSYRSAVITNGGTVHVFACDIRADNFDDLGDWANRAAVELRAALAGDS